MSELGLTTEEIDLIDRRRDHLNAMATSLVNGKPAREIILSPATVAQAAEDERRLLTALDALREELTEAYASRDYYLDRAAQRLEQVNRVRELAESWIDAGTLARVLPAVNEPRRLTVEIATARVLVALDNPAPTITAADPLIPEGTVELRYGKRVVGRIENVGDDA